MAHNKKKVEHNYPVRAAADTPPRQVLTPGGTSGLLAVIAGSNNVRPFWHSDDGTTASGFMIPAQETGQILKFVAAASVGCGAGVGIASSNGALSPAALISASGHWEVGVSVTAAAAGELFSVDFRPRKV